MVGATGCDMVAVVGLSLEMVKFESKTPNPDGGTRWLNAHSMLRPTMLRYFALTFCDCLAGALLNKQRSLSRVLHCAKTRRAFEKTREM